ncbi:DUF4214 domain-containing protein [Noviherbaspirillum sp. CPCC 100848]|uniref:DUF4214 domain-containing protein n=1 Tax=Noviherbaspirillum album TaxID=3080276 RepID=A0ABU6JJ10_9BURK|nr:DUF4214 domain-containing protein [Noviherbaspirillum sp. CPCC 100848]MEC4723510.1 DUF4214 domain-containing protein [Noviherbaspirillum sp. CPCC 100848]
MATAYTSIIQQMYVAFFNRPADFQGLRTWEAFSAGKTEADLKKAISAEFAKSDEYTIVFKGLNYNQIVTKVYQNLLNRDPDVAGLQNWVDHLVKGTSTVASLVTDIIRDAGAGDVDTIKNKTTAAGKFTDALTTIDLINAYSGAAANAVAATWLKAVGQTQASLDSAVTAAALSTVTANVASNSGNAVGTTFTLTKGLDNLTGTALNDTFIGSLNAGTAGTNAELNTLSALDIIDGGAGTDTLKVQSEDGTAITLGTVKNVEIVEASGAKAVTVDTSALANVTNLNVVKAGGVVKATASATTDVKVAFASTVNTAADTITVEGGKNVAVAVTDVGNNNKIVAGVAGKGAAGTVAVETTGKAFANAGDLSGIEVVGGTSVSVKQKASADSSAAATSTTAKTVIQGNVKATSEGKTTDVTVKQDAAVFAKAAVAAVEGVAVQQSVKFSALAKDGTVQIGGLTFTAAKDLTAAEVAQAFANVAKGVAFIATEKDTQASGVYSNGTYSGSFNAAWTSAAANGDTVVFTGPKTTAATLGAPVLTGKVSTGATADATAVPTTVSEGKTAVAGVTGVMGVVNGSVQIDDKAAAESIKHVVVDGFGAVTTTNTKVLDNLSLFNGGVTYDGTGAAVAATVSVADAAKTLALNLEKVGFAAVAQTATAGAKNAVSANVTIGGTQVETLNVKSTGANQANLTAANAKALNVTGTGLLTAAASSLANVETITVKESAGLNLGTSVATSTKLTSVDASATSGAVTITIDAAKATYAGGSGVDTVSVSAATSAAPVSKTITLGAGNDTLNLSAITAANQIAAGAKFDGGADTDTLALSTVAAANDQLSANGTFEKQFAGFDKLQLVELAGTTTTKIVNLDNLNDISYVVSNNTAVETAGVAGVTPPGAVTAQGNAGTKAIQTVTFADISVAGGATVAINLNGRTLTLTNGDANVAQAVTAAQLAGAFATEGALTAGTVTTAWSGAATADWVKATAVTGTNQVIYTAANFGTAPAFTATGTGATPAVTTPGVAQATEAITYTFAVGGLAAGQSLTIDGKTVTAVSNITDLTLLAKLFAGTATLTEAAVATITGSFSTTWGGTVVGSTLVLTATTANTDVTAVPVVTASAATSTTAGLTLTNMLNDGTLELSAAGKGVNVVMKDASGAADSFNIIAGSTTASADLGTVTVNKVETINISASKTAKAVEDNVLVDKAVSNTLNLAADAAKTIKVGGAGALNLTLGADTLKVVTTIDGSANTGGLTVSAQGATNAVAITGGAGADSLTASAGTTAKADVLVGGAGNDVLYAGSNGAKLTGGEGKDVFVVQAAAKEANTYSSITDFKAGDLVQLNVTAGTAVTAFAKLTATLNESTSVFANYVDAAIAQATAGQTVVFNFKGNAYAVIDNAETGGASAATFQNGVDSIVELVGVDAANLSFNVTYGTIALV